MDHDLRNMLYRGESIRETVDIGPNRFAITSHRLLAVTPEAEGANFHEVDLPNVEGVRAESEGNERYLRWSTRPGVLGVILLVAGWQFGFDGLASAAPSGEGAAQTGVGGALGMVTGLLEILALLDDAMLVGGAVCLLIVAVLLGLYLLSREEQLVVAVAGEGDLRFAVDAPEAAATTLETALRESAESDDEGGGTAGTRTGAPGRQGGSGSGRTSSR